MTYKEALKRAVATFVAGATAAPLTSTLVDIYHSLRLLLLRVLLQYGI